MLPPPPNIPALLKHYQVWPKKGLGQNFLLDEHALARIVEAAQVGPADTVLEIGPGAGSLTRHLASVAHRVIAVEIDRHLIPILKFVLEPFDNVDILQGDFLEMQPEVALAAAGAATFKAVANIPYYITAPILRRLLEAQPRPSLIVLTVQREVAERICARPGDMSLLAVSVQFYGRPEIVARIPAGAFYPAPEVDSAVVRITPHAQPLIAAGEVDQFFHVVQAGFSQKRKQLKNSLAGGLARPVAETEATLRAAGIEPARRAETLSLEEWVQLVGHFKH